MSQLNPTRLHPEQIQATKPQFKNLYEQIEFGRFNSVKSTTAPTLYHEFIAEEGQRKFVLPAGTFVLGDHSLQVFVNGQLMRVGEDNDYQEIDSKTIEFNFGLDKDDIVVLRVNGGTSGPALYEGYRAEDGQTVFKLASSYQPGNNSLLVFVNGAYQTLHVDYEETDSLTVTFIEPLEKDDLVIFRVEGQPSTKSTHVDHDIYRFYDNHKQLIKEEFIGDGLHIVKEYYRDADGKPQRMIIRDSGFITERTYEWNGFQCIRITETTKEMV